MWDFYVEKPEKKKNLWRSEHPDIDLGGPFELGFIVYKTTG
jgi:hypothetical protein